MAEFVGLIPKAKEAKETKKYIIKGRLKFKDYIKCLQNNDLY